MRSILTRVLVIPVVAFAVAGTLAMLGPGGGRMDVTVDFTRTFNLFPDSPVRVRGVEVGVIKDLETSPGSNVVTVTMSLEADTDVPSDAGAVIITSALLGERYIQLEGGTSDTRLSDGDHIPVERTVVPFEFDEVLEGLNKFVGGLDEDEVARLVSNLANLLEGNGEQLGATIDAASGAIDALKENDEELLALASSVSDLNETIATRDTQLAALLDDFVRVSGTLTSETTDLDGALDGLVVLTRELAELLIDHRAELSADIDTLTRVGRTASRNLDQISTAILGSAELFRHADRVVDRDLNMIPLVNHGEGLEDSIADSLADRLTAICLQGPDPEQCDSDAILDALEGDGEGFCAPPIVECTETASRPVTDGVFDVVSAEPAVEQALIEMREQDEAGGSEWFDDVFDRLANTRSGGGYR